MATTRFSDDLVQATLALIAHDGIDSLTLSKVAAQAGVSRATAYREFGDKDGLLSAVAQDQIQNMSAYIVSCVDLQAHPSAIISGVVLAALRYLRNHRAFAYIRDHEPHWLLQAVLTVQNNRMDLVQTVASSIAPAIAATNPRLAVSPIQAAEILVRTVLSHSLISNSTLTDSEVADAARRAIAGGD